MTEREDAIICCRILAIPPYTSPDANILNYLNNDKEGGGAPLSFVEF